jgi:hypothetical protein
MAMRGTSDEVEEITAKFRMAIKLGQQKVALDLLEGPVDIHRLDPDGTSLLMAAAYRGFTVVCRRLIDMGVDASYGFEGPGIAYGANNDWTPPWESVVSRAKAGGFPETINFVEKEFVRAHWRRLKTLRESDRSWFDQASKEFLIDAARLGMLDICLEMVLLGVSLEEVSWLNYRSAAGEAAAGGHLRTAVVLIALGADVSSLVEYETIPSDALEAIASLARRMAASEPAPIFDPESPKRGIRACG